MAQRKRKQSRQAAAPGRPTAARPEADRPEATVGMPQLADTVTVEHPATTVAEEEPRIRVSQAAVPDRGPVTQNEFLARYAARARQRDEEARAQLIPLAPGERPWPIQASALICGLLALANLVLYVAGVKIGHKAPGIVEVLAFVILMSVCGAGMWVLWFQAVLAFMVLLGIVMIYFCLFLVEASNLLAVLYPIVIIAASGFMFWKLVRVLARMQMPERRRRAEQR